MIVPAHKRRGRTAEVVVVGAGVIGSCVVFELVRRGVHVHCIEPSRLGGLITEISFARLSAFQQPTSARFELSHAGMMAHRRLAEEYGSAPWWHPTGSLAWAEDPHAGEPSFAGTVDRLRAWGYRVEWDQADSVSRNDEPGIAFPHARTPVVRFLDEGWVDGPQLVSTMLSEAARTGLLTMWNRAVERIEVAGGRVRAVHVDSGERIPAESVVNAAGPEAPAVAATLGSAPMGGVAARSSLVIDLLTDEDPIRHMLRGAQIHARSAGPGRVRIRSEQTDAQLPTGRRAETDHRLVGDLLDRAAITIPALESATGGQDRIRVVLKLIEFFA